MPAKRTLIFIALLFVIVFSFSAAMFINLSNDHKECSTLVTKEWDEKGNKITKEEHVCKEKFSF